MTGRSTWRDLLALNDCYKKQSYGCGTDLRVQIRRSSTVEEIRDSKIARDDVTRECDRTFDLSPSMFDIASVK